MSLTLPQAPASYDRSNEQQARGLLAKADGETFKKGQDVQLRRGERLIMPDSVTGALYQVDIQSGAIVLVGPL